MHEATRITWLSATSSDDAVTLIGRDCDIRCIGTSVHTSHVGEVPMPSITVVPPKDGSIGVVAIIASRRDREHTVFTSALVEIKMKDGHAWAELDHPYVPPANRLLQIVEEWLVLTDIDGNDVRRFSNHPLSSPDRQLEYARNLRRNQQAHMPVNAQFVNDPDQLIFYMLGHLNRELLLQLAQPTQLENLQAALERAMQEIAFAEGDLGAVQEQIKYTRAAAEEVKTCREFDAFRIVRMNQLINAFYWLTGIGGVVGRAGWRQRPKLSKALIQDTYTLLHANNPGDLEDEKWSLTQHKFPRYFSL